MPDNSGPAFDTTSGISRRLWLAAHAPPPPPAWIKRETEEFTERAQNPRRSDIKPSEATLDAKWRWEWAGRMLAISTR